MTADTVGIRMMRFVRALAALAGFLCLFSAPGRCAESGATAVGFLVFFFNQMTGALAAADIIPPLLGAWAPPLVALLSGLALLCYTEDG